MYYLFGPFCLDPEKRMLLRDGKRVSLPAKALDMLLAIATNKGGAIAKEELTNKVWGTGILITDNNFNVTLRAVRKALGDSGRKPTYIVKTPQGYQLMGEITEIASDDTPSTNSSISDTYEDYPKADNDRSLRSYLHKLTDAFGGHRFYVLSACIVYAGLYGVALLSEVAYQFDRYGPAALKITPLVSFWIFVTSVIGLAVDWGFASKGRRNGLAFCVSIYLVAASVLFVLLLLFLPASAITEANFQTYTAQAAYLKDILYFFPLALIFMIIPFHFIITMQRELLSGRDQLILGLLTGDKASVPPRGAIYPRIWALGLLLVLMAAYFLIARARLLDNLSPGPYMNLFQQLIHVRLILYFGLAIQCLAWYYKALTELKRKSLIITHAAA